MLCTDGVATPSEDESRRLSKNNISIREERIVRLEEKKGQLENIVLRMVKLLRYLNWSGKEHAGVDIFRFNDEGKILEH